MSILDVALDSGRMDDKQIQEWTEWMFLNEPIAASLRSFCTVHGHSMEKMYQLIALGMMHQKRNTLEELCKLRSNQSPTTVSDPNTSVSTECPKKDENVGTIETDDYIVKYPCDSAVKDAVFNRVIKFFIDHETFNAECIMQKDSPQIEAPSLLAEIADDIIKFHHVWKNEE